MWFQFDECIHSLKNLFQADALRMALEAKKKRANVYVGMRYWYPFTEEAIEQVGLSIVKQICTGFKFLRRPFVKLRTCEMPYPGVSSCYFSLGDIESLLLSRSHPYRRNKYME